MGVYGVMMVSITMGLYGVMYGIIWSNDGQYGTIWSNIIIWSNDGQYNYGIIWSNVWDYME